MSFIIFIVFTFSLFQLEWKIFCRGFHGKTLLTNVTRYVAFLSHLLGFAARHAKVILDNQKVARISQKLRGFFLGFLMNPEFISCPRSIWFGTFFQMIRSRGWNVRKRWGKFLNYVKAWRIWIFMSFQKSLWELFKKVCESFSKLSMPW